MPWPPEHHGRHQQRYSEVAEPDTAANLYAFANAIHITTAAIKQRNPLAAGPTTTANLHASAKAIRTTTTAISNAPN